MIQWGGTVSNDTNASDSKTVSILGYTSPDSYAVIATCYNGSADTFVAVTVRTKAQTSFTIRKWLGSGFGTTICNFTWIAIDY